MPAGEYNPENVDKSKMHQSFANVIKQRSDAKKKLSGIKHIIGVYSAKGGVGKTTVSVNLAYALSMLGNKVGILDADIDCPNVAYFMGVGTGKFAGYPLVPLEKDGIKVISTSMFFDDSSKPMIWRGPILTKMLNEFILDTEWGELDYLVIDLSPGTSDAPLSIMQLLPMEGFVLVTTPQHIAAINTLKSGTMISKFGVGILGVVENMSSGSIAAGAEVAEKLSCDVLGSVPWKGAISESADKGMAAVLQDNEIKDIFVGIAKKIAKA